MPTTFEAPVNTQHAYRSIEQKPEMLPSDRLLSRRLASKEQMALDAAIQAGASSFDLAARNFPALFLLASSY